MEKTLSIPTRPVQLSQVMLAGMLCMALLGAATTYYGPTLVYVAAESNQPIAAVGVVSAMHGAGFFLSTLVANRLARRLEMRRGVVIGCLFVGLGALGYAALPFPLNVASAFSVGFGAGILEVLLNRLVELLAVNEPAALLLAMNVSTPEKPSASIIWRRRSILTVRPPTFMARKKANKRGVGWDCLQAAAST